MFEVDEFIPLLVLWLAFMAVLGAYVVKISLMLREQKILERAYRLKIATIHGKAIREAGGPIES